MADLRAEQLRNSAEEVLVRLDAGQKVTAQKLEWSLQTLFEYHEVRLVRGGCQRVLCTAHTA